jgi:transposase
MGTSLKGGKETSMFLRLSRKKDGRVYASIARSYRDGKKTLSKTYLSLGYLDPTSPDFDKKVSEYKALAEEMEANYLKEAGPVVVEFSRQKKVDKKAKKRKNVGYAVLADKYYSLGIASFLTARAKSRAFEYDVNAIFRLLVWQRGLSPGSKKQDWEEKGSYFDKSDFALEDVYRALDFFASQKDAMIKRINERIAVVRQRNTSEVYYDTTNYYFEIDEDDPDVVDEETGRVLTEGLRKRGVSKENKRSPIVSMGLLCDSDGIPIHYELFPGNTNDCETAIPVLSKVRQRYALGRIVMVADRGINTSDNIAACTLGGMGFIFSQSVKRSNKALKDWVLSDEGYMMASDGFKCKSQQGMKTIYVKDPSGKAKRVELPVKYVAFWGVDYDRRAKAQRARVIEKAKGIASDKAKYEHARSFGTARYVKETVIDEATGEVMKTLLELDEARIAEDERYDGYYLIITSEADKSADDIIDAYRGLWRIEEAFKVTKSEIEDRPVRVWTPAHIEAHFLICYVALTIIRLIQADFNYRYSAKKILSELKALQCSHLKDNIWHFDYRSDITDDLCANAGVTFNREIMTLKDIKGELAKARKA